MNESKVTFTVDGRVESGVVPPMSCFATWCVTNWASPKQKESASWKRGGDS
jgi:hypothetical protein